MLLYIGKADFQTVGKRISQEAGGRGIKRIGLRADEIISEEPNFITFAIGTNDYNTKNRLYYSNLIDFYKRLNNTIDTLKTAIGEELVILLMTTWNSQYKKHMWFLSYLYDFIIKKVGKKRNLPVADIMRVWKNRNDTYCVKRQVDYLGKFGDGFHPNVKAYLEIADIIFEQFTKVKMLVSK